MKTAVRNIVRDLVEKRLWPVAIALLVSIVAVPVILGRGGAPDTAPVAPGVQGSAPGAPAIQVADASASSGDHGGRVRNPFGTAADAASTTAGSAGTGSATPSSSPSTSAGSTPVSASSASGAPAPAVAVHATPASSSSTGAASGSTQSISNPAPARRAPAPASGETISKTTPPKAGTSATYSVTVRFGRTDGTRRTLRDVARLTALPNAKAPVVSLLGVLRGGHTAVLRVGPTATASGNGACKPSAASCTTVELNVGDAEYFRVAGARGDAVAWYYLKLLHVDRHESASKAVAAAARVRHSVAGAAVVRAATASVRAYRFLPGLGVLVRARHRTGGAAEMAAAHVQPLLPADEQPGVAAWRSVPPRAKH